MEDCTNVGCLNNSKCCYKCFNGEFYKEPKAKKQLGDNRRKTVKSTDDSWKELEAQVAKDISNIPKYYDSRRQIQSGAIWALPGDVADNVVHIEAKEREGNAQESKGTKSFTISKEWLDKSAEEADRVRKPTFLPFRFKGDTIIHVVTQWKYIAELITMVKSLMIENDRKEIVIKELTRQLNEYKT